MRARRIAILTMSLGLGGAIGAAAQSPDPGLQPAQGLFGSGPAGRPQTLDASLSLIGAYDDNLVPFEDEPVIAAETRQGGAFGGVNGSVRYTRRFRSVAIAASERSLFRYYPTFGDLVGLQHLASAGLAVRHKSTEANVTQTFGTTPLFLMSNAPALGPGGLAALPPALSDQMVDRRDGLVLESFLEVAQALGGRTSLRVSGSRRRVSSAGDGIELGSDAAGTRLTHRVTRDLGLVFGYRYEQSLYKLPPAAPQITRLHSLDLGVDFARALSVSRRITLEMTSGSAAVEDVGGGLQYRVVGNARLTRAFGRTWSGSMAYHRGLGFVDGFPEPFFSDSISADVRGMLSPRAELVFTGDFAKGEMGLTATSSRHETYHGTARFRFALSRHAALTSQYVYYRYRFDSTAVLPLGVPSTLERHGLRVGVDLWLPVLR
jgi:hypothetical protein